MTEPLLPTAADIFGPAEAAAPTPAPLPSAAEAPAGVDLAGERHLLGVVLLGRGKAVEALMAGLSTGDFWRLAHRQIWDAVVTIAGQGLDPTVPLVGQCLRDRGLLMEIGPVYLSRLTDGVPCPTPDGLQYQVGRLRRLTTARQAAAQAHALAAAIERHPQDVAELVADGLAALDAAIVPVRSDAVALEPIGQWQALMTELLRDPAQAISWGWPGLDEQIPRIYPGEVFGLMARPSVGKTLLLTHLVRRMATRSQAHVLFSLEMPGAQIAARVARAVYGLTRPHLEAAARRGELSPQTYLDATPGFTLLDTPGLSLAEMDGRLRALKAGPLRETPIRVVTIDHLGLIGGDRRMSTYDRVSTQARELKEFAKRHGVTVVVAIQVSRDAGGDGSRRFSMAGARDSGVIEEALDYAIGLRRLEYATDATEDTKQRFRDVIHVWVAKNRHDNTRREIALQVDDTDLSLREVNLPAEEADVKDILRRGRR